jgi:hypothetical protein
MGCSRLSPNSRPLLTLPASAFPDFADAYVCDKCSRDRTKHFHRGRAHSSKAMGRKRYRCQCGQNYLTGATEWDHFSERERRRLIQFTLGFAVVFSAIISVPGLAAYLALRYIFYLPRVGLVVGALIAVFPFLLMVIPFSLGVVSSMWRTRVDTRTAPARE